MSMSKQKSGPRTDYAHDASRCADELGYLNEYDYGQSYHPGARDKSRNQIADRKPDRTDRALQRRAKDVERKKIEKQMNKTCVQKKRGEQTPVLALHHYGVRFERTEVMQYFGVRPTAKGNLEDKRRG